MQKKIAFIGSVGSGKTTIIQNLSEISPINTDVKSTVNIGKEMTTVGIDFGQLALDEDTILGLYGVPGQRKFSFIWNFVQENLWGTAILIKNQSKESIEELDYLIDYFKINEDSLSLIAITHADITSGEATIKEVREILKRRGLNLPVYTIDSRKTSSALLLIKTLIKMDQYK